jgi:hypothetical protein
LLALPLLCHAEAGNWAGDGNMAPATAAQAVTDAPAQPRDVELRRLPQDKPQAGARARTSKQAKADSDASRCDMARDIKNDKLALSNGMPIDANDLQTAENDIRRFCR